MKGRALLPGFIDAHSHVLGLAESEHLKVPIQIPPRKDVAAILEALHQKQAQLAPGAWLFGQGTYYQPMPTREQLDEDFPNNPVVLWWSEHDQIMNHRASVELGLTKDAPDPKGSGRYERTADGEVKIVRDAVVAYPVPQFTYEQAKEAVRETLANLPEERCHDRLRHVGPSARLPGLSGAALGRKAACVSRSTIRESGRSLPRTHRGRVRNPPRQAWDQVR